MITHVVCLKLRDPATDLDETVRRLRSLEGNVPSLRSVEVGIDVLHAERSFDVALVATFDSIDGLLAYQSDPFHVEVANYLGTVREHTVTVDYET